MLCLQEPGFAEVLPNLTAQEMDWLVLGELQMALERAGGPGLRISGHIAARQSCDGEAGWGLAPRAHTTERHRQVARVDMGGILGAWGMNGCEASPLPPFCPSAVLQSVLCGADALVPVQTGAAGSASLTLLGNGSLIYQVRVRG